MRLFDQIFQIVSLCSLRATTRGAGFTPARKRNWEMSRVTCHWSLAIFGRHVENYVTCTVVYRWSTDRKSYIQSVPRLMVNRGMILCVKMCRKERVKFAECRVAQVSSHLFFFNLKISKYKKNVSLNFSLK